MVCGPATLALLIVLAFAPPSRAAEPLHGLVEYLDHGLASGRRADVESLVRGLEENPLPDTPSRTQLTEALIGLFTARRETSFAARIAALPVAAPAPLPERSRPLSFPRDHGVHRTSISEGGTSMET